MDDGEFVPVEVQSIHRNKAPCRSVRASQSASLGLDAAPVTLRSGMVLISAEEKPTACLFFQVNTRDMRTVMSLVACLVYYKNLKSHP